MREKESRVSAADIITKQKLVEHFGFSSSTSNFCYNWPHWPELVDSLEDPLIWNRLTDLLVTTPRIKQAPLPKGGKISLESRSWTYLFEQPFVIDLAQDIASLSSEEYQALPRIQQTEVEEVYLERLMANLDEDIAAWLPKAQDRSANASEPFFTLGVWNYLYGHRNLPLLVHQVPLTADLLIQATPELMNLYVTFPDFAAKTENHLASAREDLVSQRRWDVCLTEFIKTISMTGQLPIPDSAVNAHLIREYIQHLPDSEAAQEEFDSLPAREWLYRVYFLRNRLSLKDLAHLKLSALDEPSVRESFLANKEQDLQAMAWLESPHNPIAHLLSSMGYEIEDINHPEIPDRVYRSFADMGIRHTVGHEIAFDPFWHWRSAQSVVKAWFESGMTDLYDFDEGYRLSLHTTQGNILNYDLGAHLMRFLQLTGYAWCPRPDPKKMDSGYQLLDIHKDQKGLNEAKSEGFMRGIGDEYLETKSFKVMSLEGLRQHIRLQGRLALLYRGLFEVFSEEYKEELDEVLQPYEIDELMIRSHRLPSEAELAASKLPYDVIALAKLGKEFVFNVELALDYSDLKGYLNQKVSRSTAKTLGKTNETILPSDSPWIRDTVDVKNYSFPRQWFRYQDEEFTNAIAYARAIGEDYGHKAESLVAEAVKDFLQLQAEFPNRTAQLSDQAHERLVQLFERFPCGLKDQRYRSSESLMSHLELVRGELQQAGLIDEQGNANFNRVEELLLL